jgi:hypothetical protein
VSKKKRAIYARPDFQFTDKAFLESYALQEEILADQKQKQLERIKSLTLKEAKLRRTAQRKSHSHGSRLSGSSSANPAPVTEMDVQDTPLDGVAGAGSESSIPCPEADIVVQQIVELQEEIDSGKFEMPAAMVDQYAAAQASSFPDWNRFDFKAFVDTLERVGRNRVKLATIVAEATNKSFEDALRYYDTFFARASTESISDCNKIFEKADKGDRRALKELEMTRALEQKMSAHPDPWISFPLLYHGTRGKFFSPDNDIFILLAVHKHGYGCWDRLLQEIRVCPRFRFDWFIKSRTVPELQKRADLLLRLVEREIEKLSMTTTNVVSEASQPQEGETFTSDGSIVGDVVDPPVGSADASDEEE